MIKIHESSMTALYIAFLSIFLGVIAQLTLKKGMNDIGLIDLSKAIEIYVLFEIFTNKYVLLGISFYIFGLFTWLLALSHMDVSMIYPLQSLGYVIVLFGSFIFLGESLSLSRTFGIFLIVLGTLFVLRT